MSEDTGCKLRRWLPNTAKPEELFDLIGESMALLGGPGYYPTGPNRSLLLGYRPSCGSYTVRLREPGTDGREKTTHTYRSWRTRVKRLHCRTPCQPDSDGDHALTISVNLAIAEREQLCRAAGSLSKLLANLQQQRRSDALATD